MRNIFLLATMTVSFVVSAQQQGSFYVAVKSGLDVHERPDTNSKTIGKVLYGTKIKIATTEEELKEINIKGLRGYWQKIIYKNSPGYIADVFLLPMPPPILGKVKETKDYLNQLSPNIGKSATIHYMTTENSLPGELVKHYYKNGAEWQEQNDQAHITNVYFFPGLSLQQGFLLVNLIPEFQDFFPNGEFSAEKVPPLVTGEEGIPAAEEEVLFSVGAYTFRLITIGDELVIYLSLFI